MTLYQKAKAVDHLFARLDKDIKKFTSTTQLHCLLGCGRCCTKPDIDATILEFLPMAMHYYLTGKGEEMLEKLKLSGSACHVFIPTNKELGSGFCGAYVQRGLICRLFGFSARRTKNDTLQLYTCSDIKQSQPEEFLKTSELINIGRSEIPIVVEYYQRLSNIDPDLCREYYPINKAAARALEYVMHYYAYRRPPRKLPKAG